MNEQLNQSEEGPAVPSNKRMMIGLAAALVAAPLGAYAIYQQLHQADQRGQREMEKSFAYDDSAIRKADAKDVGYHEAGRIDIGLSEAKAMCVDPTTGDILVSGAKAIRRLSADGKVLGDIAIPQAVHALAVGRDGVIYAAFKDHVELLKADGKKLAAWDALDGKAYLTCVAVGEGAVYVADAGRKLVMQYDMAGKVVRELGKADKAKQIPGLLVPSAHLDVQIGQDGLVWIANPGRHRVEAYNASGELAKFWGEAGTNIKAFHGCCNPSDFIVLADGTFVVAEKGVPRIKHHNDDGTFESLLTLPSALADNPQGFDVAQAKDGRMLVLSRHSREIRVYEKGAR